MRCHSILGCSLLAACHARTIAVTECATPGDCVGSDVSREVEPGAPGAADPAAVTPAEVASSALPAPVATVLPWDAMGLVLRGYNRFGIQGGWFKNGDCSEVESATAAGMFVCPANPPTPNCCSAWAPELLGPDGEAGWTITGGIPLERSGVVCLKGLASQVLNDVDGQPAFSAQWGMSLALILNDWEPFDATRVFPGGPIRGFALDLDGPLSGPLLLGVAMVGSYDNYYKEVFAPSRVTVLFDELVQAEWAMTPTPLDLSRLLAIDFHIAVFPERTTPVEFCVSNLVLLQ